MSALLSRCGVLLVASRRSWKTGSWQSLDGGKHPWANARRESTVSYRVRAKQNRFIKRSRWWLDEFLDRIIVDRMIRALAGIELKLRLRSLYHRQLCYQRDRSNDAPRHVISVAIDRVSGRYWMSTREVQVFVNI